MRPIHATVRSLSSHQLIPGSTADDIELQEEGAEFLNRAGADHEPAPKRSNSAKKPPKLKESFLTRFWVLELLCCVGSILAILAIAMVLYAYDNYPQPDWPHGLTINSLIQILTEVFKASMIFVLGEAIGQTKWIWFRHPHKMIDLDTFDSASRGSYGSMKLLATLGFRHIAVIGAICTIASLAVGPFIQQSISFYSCSQLSTNDTATIATVHVWIPNGTFNGAQRVDQFPNPPVSIDSGMASAIYQGLLNPSSKSLPDFRCSTGNCKFARPYASLGVCSSCANAAYYLKTTCSPAEEDYYQGFTENGYNDGPGSLNCTSYLHNGLHAPLAGWYMDLPLSNPNASMIMSTSIDTANPNMSLTNPVGYQFATFSMATMTKANCTTQWFDTPSQRNENTDCLGSSSFNVSSAQPDAYNVLALECSLSLCAYWYESNISNGVLEEQIMHTSGVSLGYSVLEQSGIDTFSYLVADRCFSNGSAIQLYNISLDPAGDARGISYGQRVGTAALDNGSIIGIPDDCVFYWPTGLQLADLFSGDFDLAGSVTGKAATPIALTYSPSWMETFFNDYYATFETVDTAMAGLANIMTNRIRSGPSFIEPQPLSGEVYISATCVHANWWWLSFPLACALASCIFLVMVIFVNHRHKTMLWKSRTIPFLFAGLDDTLHGKLGAEALAVNMEEAAEIQIALRSTNVGWRFVQTEDACQE